MPERNWTVAEPRRITFDAAVEALHVRVVAGAVNVVGVEEGPARLEVSALDGPPLVVTEHRGEVTVAYEDLPWKGLLNWLDRKGWKRHAVVSLAVPPGTRVEVGVVSAEAVLSGLCGDAVLQGVTGHTTLVGLSGRAEAKTVSGGVDAHALSGDLVFSTVSGDLTVIEGTGSRVRAESVSGAMVLDLDPSAGADVQLNTVSGEIAIRIPEPGDARVNAGTTSGAVSCAFDELRVTDQWGARRISGTLGDGRARLRATTVSGALALLRRPPMEPTEPDLLRKER